MQKRKSPLLSRESAGYGCVEICSREVSIVEDEHDHGCGDKRAQCHADHKDIASLDVALESKGDLNEKIDRKHFDG